MDGIKVVPWKSAHALSWDVTCIDIFVPSNVPTAALCAGMVARQSEERKNALYRELQSTHVFVPIAIETSGVFGEETMSFLKEVGYCIK